MNDFHIFYLACCCFIFAMNLYFLIHLSILFDFEGIKRAKFFFKYVWFAILLALFWPFYFIICFVFLITEDGSRLIDEDDVIEILEVV